MNQRMVVLLFMQIGVVIPRDDLRFSTKYNCLANEIPCLQESCNDFACDGTPLQGSNQGRCLCHFNFFRNYRGYCIRRSLCPHTQGIPLTSRSINRSSFVEIRPREPGPRSKDGPPDRSSTQSERHINEIVDNQIPSKPEFDFERFLENLPLLFSAYNVILGDHFYSTNLAEMSEAARVYGYKMEGPIGRLAAHPHPFNVPCNRLRPLYRLFEAMFARNHFYTMDKREGRKAERLGYKSEGVAGYCVAEAPDCGASLPIHRFWNNRASDHIYVTNMKDYEKLRSDRNWRYEGIECYIWKDL